MCLSARGNEKCKMKKEQPANNRELTLEAILHFSFYIFHSSHPNLINKHKPIM